MHLVSISRWLSPRALNIGALFGFESKTRPIPQAGRQLLFYFVAHWSKSCLSVLVPFQPCRRCPILSINGCTWIFFKVRVCNWRPRYLHGKVRQAPRKRLEYVDKINIFTPDWVNRPFFKVCDEAGYVITKYFQYIFDCLQLILIWVHEDCRSISI